MMTKSRETFKQLDENQDGIRKRRGGKDTNDPQKPITGEYESLKLDCSGIKPGGGKLADEKEY